MGRQRIAPPAYVQQLADAQNGGNYGQSGSVRGNGYGTSLATYRTPSSADQNANYSNAVNGLYNNDSSALLSNQATANQYMQSYDPRQAAAYAASQQQMYQGGPAVSTQALGQARYDQSMRNNLNAVAAQRGSGGQAQGLRAAMQGTTGASGNQQMAAMQANQDQIGQRQQILNQRLQMEGQQAQADKAYAEEEHRWDTEKQGADADTQGQVVQSFGNMARMMSMSDKNTKQASGSSGKKVAAPKLVIMIHHGGGKY